jgi:hypothetical protein
MFENMVSFKMLYWMRLFERISYYFEDEKKNMCEYSRAVLLGTESVISYDFFHTNPV